MSIELKRGITFVTKKELRNLKMRENKNIFDFYRMQKMLGAGKRALPNLEGGFGEVWMCIQRETGAHRAVKVIKRKV